MSSTIRQLLTEAQHRLATTLALPMDEARIEAQMLMRTALGDVSRAWLIIHDHELPTPAQTVFFSERLQRRLNGEPIAYILGEREFFGLNFSVSPDVLIPRPDTETLVEAALERIPPTQPCQILDMGTGTGIIAITLALQRTQAQITAIDASSGALKIAEENRRKLGADNLTLLQSDWFSGLRGRRFDVIVSNPPYIAEHDPHLAQGDLRFEPAPALASGVDGLDAIRTIIRHAPDHLTPMGWLMLEHGYNQADGVAALLVKTGFANVQSLRDLAGVPRVTLGRL